MKKILFFTLGLLILAPLAAQNKTNVEMLTLERFKTEVYDWEKSPTEWLYNGKKPCIIDCYADWCGPCRRLAPTLETLAEEYKGKVIVYKVNVSKEKELAHRLNMMTGNTKGSIPMLLYIPMKEQPQVSLGLRSIEDLRKVFNEFLLKKR